MGIVGTDPTRSLNSIQLCRGLAALAVTLLHLSISAKDYFNTSFFFNLFSWGGAAGVCFFFVLSGFIITSVHWKDLGDPAKFPIYLYKRLIRIYPIFWLVFFPTLLIKVVFFPNSDLPSDTLILLKTVALLPQDPYTVGTTGAPVLVVAWSLQYEMLFYTFFGLLILNKIAGLMFAVIIFSFSFLGYFLKWSLPLGFLNPVYLLLFGIGFLAGLAVMERLWSSYSWIIAFLGAFLLLAASLIDSNLEMKPLFIYGVAGGLLILGFALIENIQRFKIWRGWLLLGDASYVLYLIHYPIISLICKIAIAAGLAGFVGGTITWVVTLAICILAAVIIHIMIEKPLLNTSRAIIDRYRHARNLATPPSIC